MAKRLDIASAKLTVVFPEGKLPALDPVDPAFVLSLSGLKIFGTVNAKAARKLAAHQGGAVLQGKLIRDDEQELRLVDAGFTWIDPKPQTTTETPADGTAQASPTTDA